MPVENVAAQFAPRIQSPYDVQNALGQQALQQSQIAQNALAMQERQRALASDDQVRQAVMASGGDPARLRQALVGSGNYAALDKHDQTQADLAEKNARAAKEQQVAAGEQLKNRQTKVSALASMWEQAKKPEDVPDIYKRAIAEKLLEPGEAFDLINKVPTDPEKFPDYRAAQVESGKTLADKLRIAHEQLVEQGLTARNNATNQTHIQTNAATNATAMRNTDAHVSATLRGQNMVDDRMRDPTVQIKHGAAGLTPEQNEALFGEGGAVTTGKLDPNRINSRTASLLADAFIKNPNTDMAKLSADINLSRNATFRQRAMTAEVLPEIMDNMVQAGKKVNFSNFEPIGRMQLWAKGKVNDPDLTSYMTQRNDALMTIAGVMRGSGMTDQAHKAEIEAQNPTMAPAALDAWYAAQMKSLGPRMKLNSAITKNPIPEPPATGGKVVKFGDLK